MKTRVLAWLSFTGVLLSAVASRSLAAGPTACEPHEGPDACSKACRAGSHESCAILGIMHLRGEVGTKPDHAQAEKLLRRACSAGVALGCGGLGSLYGVKNDFKRARPLFEKACTMGDALSCESLGGLEAGAASPTPPEDLAGATRRANVYYKRACELGSGPACAFCAAFIVDHLVEGTARQALEYYVTACNRGTGIACRQAADFLRRDTPEVKALAASLDAQALSADLLTQACKLGDARACARTGK